MSSILTSLGCLKATILLISQLVTDNVSWKEYGAINCCPAMSSIVSCLKPFYYRIVCHSIIE